MLYERPNGADRVVFRDVSLDKFITSDENEFI